MAMGCTDRHAPSAGKTPGLSRNTSKCKWHASHTASAAGMVRGATSVNALARRACRTVALDARLPAVSPLTMRRGRSIPEDAWTRWRPFFRRRATREAAACALRAARAEGTQVMIPGDDLGTEPGLEPLDIRHGGGAHLQERAEMAARARPCPAVPIIGRG